MSYATTSSNPYNRGKKRRRAAGAAYARRVLQKRNGGRPGYTRTVGFYGRFSGRGLNVEKKFLDTNVGINGDDQGAIFNSGTVCVVPEGDGQSNRHGRKITITSVMLRGRFTLDATAPTPDRMRIIMYLDKQCNGATLAASDILTNASGSAATIDGFRNLEETHRVVVLADKTYTLQRPNGNATVALAVANRTVTMYKKCNIEIVYDNSATTGAIATIRSNNIGFMLINQLDTAANAGDFNGNIRIRYTDV